MIQAHGTLMQEKVSIKQHNLKLKTASKEAVFTYVDIF